MEKKLSLLEKANQLASHGPAKQPLTSEDVDLCVAWALGKIKSTHITKVKGFQNGMMVYQYLLRGLKQYAINTSNK